MLIHCNLGVPLFNAVIIFILCVLQELIGSAAGKLHTGRSRNDQVATDMRLWIRDEIASIRKCVMELTAVLVNRAEQ